METMVMMAMLAIGLLCWPGPHNDKLTINNENCNEDDEDSDDDDGDDSDDSFDRNDSDDGNDSDDNDNDDYNW